MAISPVGGNIYGNLSVQDSIALETARDEANFPDGFLGIYKHNVILDPKGIQATLPRRWGIRIKNANGQLIEDNIIADNVVNVFYIDPNIRNGVQMYVRNVSIKDN